jgi:prevent-host-death family protein
MKALDDHWPKQNPGSPFDDVEEVATGSYIEYMRAVGIKTLKNRLSEYIRLVRAGETVLVTDRDQVVAELVPPQAERSANLADALLAEAVRKGWVTAPFAATGEVPSGAPVASLADLVADLREDRDAR